MEKKYKELLLKYICERLPYGIKASYYGVEEECETLDEIEGVTLGEDLGGYVDIGQYSLPIECIKPYLFTLSSMTEEQKKYISNKCGINEEFYFEIDPNLGECFVELGDTVDFIDWLNKNHFDYRGLIDKSLALDANGLNIY